MSLLRNLARGMRSLFRKEQVDRELDEELRAYQEMAAEEKMKDGMSRKEALRAVRLERGSLEVSKEIVRSGGWEFFVETCSQDLRFGVRMLRKSPGFTAIAILTLALGIGANTAMFSVVDTVLLRPLPYKDPSRLVWATEHFGVSPSAVVGPDFAAWRDHNRVFEQIEAFAGAPGANLTGAGEPTRVSVTNVSTGLFSMLGVQPIAGRTFRGDDGKAGHEHVAILSETLWRTRFSGDPHIIGNAIRLDGTAYTVVGITPATVHYPQADVWTPIVLGSETFSPHSPRWMILTAIGRLKTGMDISHAQSDLQLTTQQNDKEYPPQAAPFRSHERVEVISLHEFLVQNVNSLLMILLGATVLVLLIACANVANLLFSRGIIRGKEIAVRAALGAGRLRLVRQLLTEGLLLVVIGGLLGFLTGLWATRILEQLIPSSLPSQIHLDPTILTFSVALSALALLLFALVPAANASGTDVNQALKEGGRRAGAGTSARRLFTLMPAAEIALSLILLVGAGLLIRSFLRLTELDPGFDPHGLLIATVERPFIFGFDARQNMSFFSESLERIRNLPGVQEVAMTERYPLGPPRNGYLGLRVQGAQNFHPPQPISVTAVSPDYFHLMRIHILSGREFSERDAMNSQTVVIMNQSLARMIFGTSDPVGQRVGFGDSSEPWREVIGVVADVKEDAIGREPLPEIFVPYLQNPAFAMTFVLRTASNPETLASAIRVAVQDVDKDQPVSQIATMDELFAKSLGPRRFRMLLLALFAMLALMLATIGIYGVIAHSCAQRTSEFGLRVALGAGRGEIIKLVIRQGLAVAALGVGSGLVFAFLVVRFVASLLYGVKPTDPITFIAVPVLLTGVALAACYIPARRATRVDPLVALRYE